jgi:hypothetical protein
MWEKATGGTGLVSKFLGRYGEEDGPKIGKEASKFKIRECRIESKGDG